MDRERTGHLVRTNGWEQMDKNKTRPCTVYQLTGRTHVDSFSAHGGNGSGLHFMARVVAMTRGIFQIFWELSYQKIIWEQNIGPLLEVLMFLVPVLFDLMWLMDWDIN